MQLGKQINIINKSKQRNQKELQKILSKMKRIIFLLAALSVIFCAGISSGAQYCDRSESPSQICYMMVMPVCGFDESGNSSTYANECFACRNSKVVYYTNNACDWTEGGEENKLRLSINVVI